MPGTACIEKENEMTKMIKPKHPKTMICLVALLFPVLVIGIIIAVIIGFTKAGIQIVDDFIAWL